MSPAGALDDECSGYCRYLTGRRATDYVASKYAAAHVHRRRELTAAPRTFDRLLWRLSTQGVWATRLADGYARFMAPSGVLRKKLVLLLAILECSPPFYEFVDSADAHGNVAACVRLAVSMALGGAISLAALVAIGPFHLLHAIFHRLAPAAVDRGVKR